MVVFTQQTGGENIEEELGLAGATADDAEIEYIRRLCEKEVVSGNNNQSKILDVLSLIIYAHKINMSLNTLLPTLKKTIDNIKLTMIPHYQ